VTSLGDLTGYAARIYRHGMARNRIFSRCGEREQASDSGDGAFDESPLGAKEWPCSPHLFQSWG